MQLVVFELTAGGGEKGVDRLFVDGGGSIKTFALNCPVVAFPGYRHEVYSGIGSPQILATRKFIPEPDMPEAVSVLGVSFEVCLHEPLKPVALVALGEGVVAVFGQEALEGHFGRV